MADPLIGKQLGDYVIQDILGRGGMARVYKGYDERLQRYAAVKVINSEFAATADQAEYTERFRREARAIARLHHPNIVGVYQFGDYEGNYYMAMVFVEGLDLRQILKEIVEQGGKMPYADILNIVRGIGGALDYAHSRGVIHRDIKPSNIMLDSENHAILTDFGLALSTTEGTLGDTFGSAHYIAPEQAVSSAKAVPQSDLYSLGICTYEMLTGKVPFDDPSAMSVALKHLNEAPPPPHLYNPDLTPEIEKVIFKILDKDPSQRYLTGAAFAQALESAVYADSSDDATEILPKNNASIPPAPAPKPKAGTTAQVPKTAAVSQPPKPPTTPTPIKPVRKEPDPTPQKGSPDYSTLVALAEQFNAGQTVVGTDNETATTDKKPRSILPIVAGIVLLVLIGAGVLFASGAFNRGSATPTAASGAGNVTPNTTSVAVANPTDEATAKPTNTATKVVTATDKPTDKPTATLTDTAASSEAATNEVVVSTTETEAATETGSATNTRTAATATPTKTETTTATENVTDTPAPTELDTSITPTTVSGSSRVRKVTLKYDDVQFALINSGNIFVDITKMRFIQKLSNGERTLDTALWSSNGSQYQPYNLPPGFCYQAYRNDRNEPQPFTECPIKPRNMRAAWARVASQRWFWIADPNDPQENFDVLLGDQTIASCAISAGTCDIPLP